MALGEKTHFSPNYKSKKDMLNSENLESGPRVCCLDCHLPLKVVRTATILEVLNCLDEVVEAVEHLFEGTRKIDLTGR